jgi:hypothetical protein
MIQTEKGAGRPGKDGHTQNRKHSADIINPGAFRIKGHEPSAWWRYHDASGTVVGAVSRYEAGSVEPRKSYRPWTLNGDGQWHVCAPAELPLYNLSGMLSKPEALIVLVEGEKCADAINDLKLPDLVATTTPGGAHGFKAWHARQAEMAATVTGRDIVILPDNDHAGKEFANIAAAELSQIARAVRVPNELPWSALGDGADVADWLYNGSSANQLRELIAACRPWSPGSEESSEDDETDAADDADAADDKKGKQQYSHKKLMLKVATALEMFHDDCGACYASVRVRGHTEVLELKSRAFRSWLLKETYSRHSVICGSGEAGDVIHLLEGIARTECPRAETHVRIALHGDRVYYDLADADRRIVEIDRHGWRLVSNAPVYFRRPRGMKPQVAPQAGGSLALLDRFINADERGRTLVKMFVVAALRPASNYPILNVNGEHGSAKSTMLRLLNWLVDPHDADVRKPPRDERDLSIGANNAWMLAFDNISRFDPWLSDAACRLSTGGALTTRELYSDSDETILKASRPQAYNGIEPFGNRGDYLDRAWSVTLNPIPYESRRTEAEINREFNQLLPQILGAAFDAVSAALANLEHIKLPRLPRMADATTWCTAAEPGLGWQQGTAIAALESLYGDHEAQVLDADVLAQIVLDFAQERKEWLGMPSQLLEEMRELAGQREHHLPAHANGLKGRLMRAAPVLRRNGCEVETGLSLPSGKKNGIRLTMKELPPATSAGSAASAEAPPNAALPPADAADDPLPSHEELAERADLHAEQELRRKESDARERGDDAAPDDSTDSTDPAGPFDGVPA